MIKSTEFSNFLIDDMIQSSRRKGEKTMSGVNSFSAKAIRAGYDSSEHFNSVNPPIYQTASYDLQDIDRTRRLWTGAEGGGIYSRVGNPTAGILEARIAELEGGKAAVALSSGMAAITYTLLLLGQGGGNIVSGSSLYGAAMLSLIKFLAELEGTTPVEIAERSAGNLLKTPWIETEDVVEAVKYIASDRARYMTGSQFVLDAGLLTR